MRGTACNFLHKVVVVGILQDTTGHACSKRKNKGWPSTRARRHECWVSKSRVTTASLLARGS